MNDTAIGVQVSMWINHRCWGSSRSSNWGASAGSASCWSSIACTGIATSSRLLSKQLAEQAAMTLLDSATAIAATSDSAVACTRIASSDFGTAARTIAKTASWCSDFSAAAWTISTTSLFSTAAWSCGYTCWSGESCVLSSQLGMEVSLSSVKASHLVCVSSSKLALQTLEAIQNRGANNNRTASSGFNAAARTDVSTVSAVTCTRITSRSSDFSAAARTSATTSLFNSAAWANAATSLFSAAARIYNRGIAAGARSTNATSTQQTMNQIATEALSAKGST